MPTKTKQEIFDHVLNFITAQGKASYDGSSNKCRYLSLDGLRCSVGCLMRDDAQTNKIARGLNTNAQAWLRGWTDVLKNLNETLTTDFRALFDFEIADDQIDFLQDLQRAHDNQAIRDLKENFVPEFRKRMREISLQYGLDFPS